LFIDLIELAESYLGSILGLEEVAPKPKGDSPDPRTRRRKLGRGFALTYVSHKDRTISDADEGK